MEGGHERFRKLAVFGEPPAVDLEELSSWTSHSASGSPTCIRYDYAPRLGWTVASLSSAVSNLTVMTGNLGVGGAA